MINQERLNQIILFLLLLTCYTYVFPRWADPNQNSRLNMVIAVVEDGTFKIDKYVENTVDYAKVGEHYYSDKAPGAALLGIPLYSGFTVLLYSPLLDSFVTRLSNSDAFASTLRADGSGVYKEKVRFAMAQVFLTFFISALTSAFLGVLIYRLLAKFTSRPWPRITIVLGYGLLTPAFAYAGAFYGHQLSTLLLLWAFYLGFTSKKTLSVGVLLFIGLLLGFSVVTEYPTLLVVGIIFLYLFYLLYQQGKWLKIGWVMLTGGIVAVFWMAYNTYIFGGPLELGYSYSELWVDQHHTGFMSLTMPHWDAIWGITFSPFRGLLLLSPWLLLIFPGFVLWWQSKQYRTEFFVVTLISLTVFLFNVSSIMWWGGFSIGPRYLLPMLPFAVLPTVFVFSKWGSHVWMRVLTTVLFLWSFIAVWGLTLAEQAFPSDTIRNPLVDYALPSWLDGNIARNFGTVLGMKGIWGLLPLFVLLGAICIVWWLLSSYLSRDVSKDPQDLSTLSSTAHIEPVVE